MFPWKCLHVMVSSLDNFHSFPFRRMCLRCRLQNVVEASLKQTLQLCYVIMSAMVSQITGVSIIYSTVCSGADQRKRKNSASLAFVRGIHRWLVDSPTKGPATRKMFPFDDVIPMILLTVSCLTNLAVTSFVSPRHRPIYTSVRYVANCHTLNPSTHKETNTWANTEWAMSPVANLLELIPNTLSCCQGSAPHLKSDLQMGCRHLT